MDERPVLEADAQALRSKSIDPIRRAIEFLNGKSDDPIQVAAELTRVSL